ncbi:MAG: hypothetical protein CMJ30_07350 [Phycisphaerae bacterium]|nr:hypothetical protein [Phycisphaerae bacterium]
MICGLLNLALVLITVISVMNFVSEVNMANGITYEDYEVLGEEEKRRMLSEYGESQGLVAVMVSGLAFCLSIPVMLIGSVFGVIGLLQSNAPKMSSILGLVLNLPLLLAFGCLMLLPFMLPTI